MAVTIFVMSQLTTIWMSAGGEKARQPLPDESFEARADIGTEESRTKSSCKQAREPADMGVGCCGAGPVGDYLQVACANAAGRR